VLGNNFIYKSQVRLLHPIPPEAPYPAAHGARIIFQTFHGKVLVPEVFGFVNRSQ